MVLSREKKDSLAALYSVWGIDTVRAEIERHDNSGLTPPDVIAFARGWIAAEEAKANRTIQSVKITATVSLAILGGTIVGLLIF
jgi:hypothetical protein